MREPSDGRWFQGLVEEMRQVRGLPGVLDAAYRVFEVMLTVAREHEDPDGGMFASFVFAAGSAANGRDAVASALSLPPAGPASEGLTVEQGLVMNAEEAADGLAILGEALNGLLAAAGRAAGDVRDQVACARAAGHAREVHALLVGG